MDNGAPILVAGRQPESAQVAAGANRADVLPPGKFEGGSLTPVPGVDGYFFEIEDQAGGEAASLGALLSPLLSAERDALGVAEELAARYEEIDLLYTISDTLGRTISLEEATSIIVREVSSVVGARRASIFVHDTDDDVLRPVAGWGLDMREFGSIAVGHPASIAAKVFRECQPISGDASAFNSLAYIPIRQQMYRGTAFLSAPITYPDPNGESRPVGIINLTDRIGADRFTSGHRKLVAAIAHQIGAAIENARLVTLDRQRRQVERELELAHDLQMRLLPTPDVVRGLAEVSAECRPGELVGGDFYQLLPLAGGRVGVMLGDVSTHGFPAALIMALVLSAAGIHAAAAPTPEAALDRLLQSVRSELSTTEMYLSLFYGVVDAGSATLRYANAGHPHAFIVRGQDAERLGATAPPLGLSDDTRAAGASVAFRRGEDLLILFSDGISDARSAADEPFGEQRILDIAASLLHAPTQQIVDTVFEEVQAFAEVAPDDQTLLALRA